MTSQMLPCPGVLERVLDVYDTLPNSERQIADYLLEHRSTVSDMTARDIAQESGSSAASMSRFVRKLGFTSFAQMRFTLARDRRARGEAEPVAPVGASLDLAHLDDAIDYMLGVKVEELNATARNLKASDLARVVELIRAADLTVFAGVGNSISTAQNAAFKVTQTGYRAMAPLTSDGSALMALTTTERDVLVVLSTTGYSKRVLAVMDNARDSGTPIVVITDREDSELGQGADILLKTSTHDRLLTPSLRFSQSPINFVIELITVLLYHGSSDASEYTHIFDRNMRFDKCLDDTDD